MSKDIYDSTQDPGWCEAATAYNGTPNGAGGMFCKPTNPEGMHLEGWTEDMDSLYQFLHFPSVPHAGCKAGNVGSFLQLEQVIQREQWSWENQAGVKCNFLSKYLDRQFVRSAEEGKVVQCIDEEGKVEWGCFCTGLLTLDSEEILYVIMKRDPTGSRGTPWVLHDVVTGERAGELQQPWNAVEALTQLPQRAEFVQDPCDRIFSPTASGGQLAIECDPAVWEGVEAVRGLLPGPLRVAKAAAVKAAVQAGLARAARLLAFNPRAAVPQAARAKGPRSAPLLQMLAPLKLDPDSSTTHLAAVLSVTSSRRRGERGYKCVQLCPLAEAYANARVVMPVDQAWLRPPAPSAARHPRNGPPFTLEAPLDLSYLGTHQRQESNSDSSVTTPPTPAEEYSSEVSNGGAERCASDATQESRSEGAGAASPEAERDTALLTAMDEDDSATAAACGAGLLPGAAPAAAGALGAGSGAASSLPREKPSLQRTLSQGQSSTPTDEPPTPAPEGSAEDVAAAAGEGRAMSPAAYEGVQWWMEQSERAAQEAPPPPAPRPALSPGPGHPNPTPWVSENRLMLNVSRLPHGFVQQYLLPPLGVGFPAAGLGATQLLSLNAPKAVFAEAEAFCEAFFGRCGLVKKATVREKLTMPGKFYAIVEMHEWWDHELLQRMLKEKHVVLPGFHDGIAVRFKLHESNTRHTAMLLPGWESTGEETQAGKPFHRGPCSRCKAETKVPFRPLCGGKWPLCMECIAAGAAAHVASSKPLRSYSAPLRPPRGPSAGGSADASTPAQQPDAPADPALPSAAPAPTVSAAPAPPLAEGVAGKVRCYSDCLKLARGADAGAAA